MDVFLVWSLLASVSLVATVSPGPAFLITFRNTTVHGRSIGCATALGLGCAEVTQIILVLCGLSAIISASVFIYSLIKYLGAAYLVYIGVKTFCSGIVKEAEVKDQVRKRNVSRTEAFTMGYMTNLLNPKSNNR